MLTRLLTPKERKLIELMLAGKPQAARLLPLLPTVLVSDMADGGMGSLRFASAPPDSRFGREIAEIELLDSDQVPVLITLIVDEQGALFELDSWKVDFSPLHNLQLPDFPRE